MFLHFWSCETLRRPIGVLSPCLSRFVLAVKKHRIHPGGRAVDAIANDEAHEVSPHLFPPKLRASFRRAPLFSLVLSLSSEFSLVLPLLLLETFCLTFCQTLSRPLASSRVFSFPHARQNPPVESSLFLS